MGRTGLRFFLGTAALLMASACGDGGGGPGLPGLPGGDNGDDYGPGGGNGGPGGGAGGGGSGGGGGVLGPNGEVDPRGVWWTEIEVTGKQDLPTVGTLEGSKIRFVMRVVIDGQVPNQTASFEFCDLQTEWENPLIPGDFHTIGFRPESAAAFGETLSVDFSGLGVGSHIPMPPLTFVGGGDKNGNIIDEDGDGHPAITTWVRVILPFEVAEIITIKADLDLTAADENTLTGTLGFDVKATILDSSSAVFVPSGFEVSIVPDSNAAPITVRRMPNGGDCSAVPSTITFSEVPPPGVEPIDPVLGPQYNPNPTTPAPAP